MIKKTLLFLGIALNAYAQNPIIKNIGMSDAHVRVFKDTVFLYTGHDTSPKDSTWIMKDWMIFSSTDLVNWTRRGTILPKDNYMGPSSTDCWAGDAATRNGKYYFYFSDRNRSIGVMQADMPTGPFHDALGKPLVSMHDPTAFIDDDTLKTPYLVYGSNEHGGYRIARLNNDMISLAETPQPIVINGDLWKKAPNWMDKNYIFKYKGLYYLSWGQNYATAKNVYGPYESVGAMGSGNNLNVFAHASFFWWKGQFYHVWCYYLNMRYKYRETIITYCHFTDDGKIVTDMDFLNKHKAYGVGRYDASWDKIEAEWFYEKSENAQKQSSKGGGFEMEGLKNKEWLRFSNVNFGQVFSKMMLEIPKTTGKGKIEVRLGNLNGQKVGEVNVKESDTANGRINLSVNLKPIIGENDIYLVFKGNKPFDLCLDWVKFE